MLSLEDFFFFFDSQQGTVLKYDGEHFREICDIMCVTDTTYKYLVSFHSEAVKVWGIQAKQVSSFKLKVPRKLRQ